MITKNERKICFEFQNIVAFTNNVYACACITLRLLKCCYCSGVPPAWDCYQSSERLHGITMVESTLEQWTVPFMEIFVKWWVKKNPHNYLYSIYMYYKWLILIQIIIPIVAFTILHFYKFFSITFGHTPPPFSTTSLFLINTMATMTLTISWNSYR